MKRVAQTLGVSRSQLIERLKGARKLRSAYRKTSDAELLAPLRTLVDERPTYGYRRITALMNRERLKTGLPRLNHKRVYRLMSQNSCCCSATPARHLDELTTARSSRSDPTCVGPRMASRSPAGTARSCV